jgi:hypothetical protein
MSFGIKDLMIHLLPEETWHACTCSQGTNTCGQCTSVSGDLDGGDEPEEPDQSGEEGEEAPTYELSALREQLRAALAQEAGA